MYNFTFDTSNAFKMENDNGLILIFGGAFILWLIYHFLRWVFSGRMFEAIRNHNATQRQIKNEKEMIREKKLANDRQQAEVERIKAETEVFKKQINKIQ